MNERRQSPGVDKRRQTTQQHLRLSVSQTTGLSYMSALLAVFLK
jgi:hypothetical protein